MATESHSIINIAGIVLDSSSLQPVARAELLETRSRQRLITDPNGFYISYIDIESDNSK